MGISEFLVECILPASRPALLGFCTTMVQAELALQKATESLGSVNPSVTFLIEEIEKSSDSARFRIWLKDRKVDQSAMVVCEVHVRKAELEDSETLAERLLNTITQPLPKS